MSMQISGARLLDPASGLDQHADLFIDGGKVVAIGQAPLGFNPRQLIDASGLIAAPGLVDLSVALREPGYGRKGSIASETLAAAAGERLNGFSLNASNSLRIGSVFYMSALLYPDEHKPGAPNNLEFLPAEVRGWA